MNTITVWLLINMGTYGYGPTAVVERFPTEAECQRVATAIYEASAKNSRIRCMQASVVITR